MKKANYMSSWVQVHKSVLFFTFFLTYSSFFVEAQTHKKDLSEALISYHVVDLNTDEVLADYNGEKLMTPASLLKLVTTATVLELQGAEKRNSTTIYSRGEVVNGQFRGDLIVKADADGTFGSSHFASTKPDELLRLFKQRLNQLGIYSLDGKIIFDLSVLPPPYQPAGRLIEDISNYYGASPMPLSWRDNSFQIVLKSPSSSGQLCSIVEVVPSFNDLQFNCYVESASNRKDSAYIFGYPGSNIWDIRGSIPSGRDRFIIKGALPHPEKVFADELVHCFDHSSKIQLEYHFQRPAYHTVKEILSIPSPSLSEVIKVVNQKSNNLLADHLFLGLNKAGNNPANRWTAAALITKKFWKSENFDAPFLIYDGSGLSPRNKVSSRFMVDVLKFMNFSSNADLYKNSLAIGGVSGTLRSLWQEERYRGRVFAKSGSMEGVINYAGYLVSNSNREIAFSVMINNYSGSNEVPKEYIVSLISSWIDDL